MTEEQIKKVVEIHDKILLVSSLKAKLEGSTYILAFIHDNRSLYGRTFDGIRDIMDKHDKMIRQEIDERIAELKRELEEL